MKSQDLLLLLKFLSLELNEKYGVQARINYHRAPKSWQDWKDKRLVPEEGSSDKDLLQKQFGVRALSSSTGISKSEISLALQRCREVNLAKDDRELAIPRVNKSALFNFIIHGIRVVFPAKIEKLSRGIATSFAAPVFRKKIMTAGDTIFVWPDAHGKTKGQSLFPLYKSVTYAVRQDALLYELLALIDAIRIGGARERNLAKGMLSQYFEISNE